MTDVIGVSVFLIMVMVTIIILFAASLSIIVSIITIFTIIINVLTIVVVASSSSDVPGGLSGNMRPTSVHGEWTLTAVRIVVAIIMFRVMKTIMIFILRNIWILTILFLQPTAWTTS